jgi:hypothetical protein
MMMTLRAAGLLVLTLGVTVIASAQHAQSVTASITEVEQEYANILLDASPSELRELGLTVGTRTVWSLPSVPVMRVRYSTAPSAMR